MVYQFRFTLILGALLGIGLFFVEAAQTPVDCPYARACKNIRKDENGVHANCQRSNEKDKKSTRICSVVYTLSSKLVVGTIFKKMATNPSCDQCIVWNNQEGIDRCNEYVKSYESFNYTWSRSTYKLCYTSATPYLCTNPDPNAENPYQQYLTCSIQAKDCP